VVIVCSIVESASILYPRHDGNYQSGQTGGLSSARAVARVKRLLPRGTKIGHAGTLDPFATGVLLLLVGKATKQCERLMGEAKQYEATIKLGATTRRWIRNRRRKYFEGVARATRPEVDVDSHGRAPVPRLSNFFRHSSARSSSGRRVQRDEGRRAACI
jgi:hypothetical protein